MRRANVMTILISATIFSMGLVACGESEEAAAEGEQSAASEGEGEKEAASEEAPKADEKKEEVKPAADKAAAKDVAPPQQKPEPTQAAVAAPAQPNPEVLKKCRSAYENLIKIMVESNADARIVEKVRERAEQSVAQCAVETQADPNGPALLDCMLAAKTQEEVMGCTKKFKKTRPTPTGATPVPPVVNTGSLKTAPIVHTGDSKLTGSGAKAAPVAPAAVPTKPVPAAAPSAPAQKK